MFSLHLPNSATGKLFRYRSRLTGNVTEFYADRGMIRIHYCGKTGDEEYEVVPRRVFLLRARAINDSLRVKQPSDERTDQQRLVEAMVEAARAAGEQGDPLSRQKIAEALSGQVRGQVVRRVAPGYDPLRPMPQAPASKPPVPLDQVFPQPIAEAARPTILHRRPFGKPPAG